MDLMISAESPSQISDQIKDALFVKSAARIEDLKPAVANTLFGEDEVEEVEDSISDEIPEEEEE